MCLKAANFLRAKQIFANLKMGRTPGLAEIVSLDMERQFNQLTTQEIYELIVNNHKEMKQYSSAKFSESSSNPIDAAFRELFLSEEAVRKIEQEDTTFNIDAFLEGAMQKAKEIQNSSLPTPYENPINYRIMVLADWLAKTRFRKGGFDIGANYVLGTLPFSDCNAMVMSVPDSNEYVIAFHEGLFAFLLNAVTILYIYMNSIEKDFQPQFEWLSEQEGYEKITDAAIRIKGFARQNLLELITSYIVDNYATSHSNFFSALDISHQALLSHTRLTPMLSFVMGHEHAHVLLGHFEHHSHSHRQEFEADRTSFKLMAQTMEEDGGTGLLIAATSTELFFSLLEIIDRTRSLLSYGDQDHIFPTDHPLPSERRKALQEYVAQYNPQYSTYALNGCMVLHHILLDQMFAPMIPVFLQWHQQGVRPAEEWKGSLLHLL